MSLAGLVALLSLGAPGASGPEPFRAAVVVGVNQPFDETQSRLQYADDDAARYAELLGPRVEHLELLTVLDDESQSVFEASTRLARVPDEPGLLAALARARARARGARALGRRTELYFVYVGHGRVRGGLGEVRLHGGSLDRDELTAAVLEDEAFDRKHLMVDACSAYLLVNARGEAEPDVDAAFERFLQAQTLDAYPDVGAVLATSGAGPTHEWSRYQGGVFSHELRSALVGAADADEDGRVEYAEVEAFLAAANLEVPVLEGRPKVFVRAPRIERRAALVELDGSLPRLELPAALSGHYVVQDLRGLRYAELHKEPGYVMALSLVPAQAYALRDAEGAELMRIAAPQGRLRVPLPLEPRPPPNVPRGGVGPPGAFGAPFGPRFLAGYVAQWQAQLTAEAARPPPPSPTRWVRPAATGLLAAAGAAALGLSVWQDGVADDHYARYAEAFDAQTRDRAADDVRSARARRTGLAVGAGVALAGAVGLLVWELLD